VNTALVRSANDAEAPLRVGAQDERAIAVDEVQRQIEEDAVHDAGEAILRADDELLAREHARDRLREAAVLRGSRRIATARDESLAARRSWRRRPARRGRR
jgi:hypothetical protein